MTIGRCLLITCTGLMLLEGVRSAVAENAAAPKATAPEAISADSSPTSVVG
jgi:hypothetical protein